MTRLLLALLLSSAAHAQLRPGDIDPAFGNQGWTRIPFDRPGESAFDAARYVRVRSEPVRVGNFTIQVRYIYVAGQAGDRIAIVKLNADGTLATEFGNNGRAISTQGDIGRLAGLEFAPNGDVVVGYSVRDISNSLAHAELEDFFVEVFTREGAPRIQQTTIVNFVPAAVNWLGVDIVNYTPQLDDDELCHPDAVALSVEAHSMATSPSGELALVGHRVNYARAPGLLDGYSLFAQARFQFDAGAQVYRRAPGSMAPHPCSGGQGGFENLAQIPQGDVFVQSLRTPFLDDAQYLQSGDLRAVVTGAGFHSVAMGEAPKPVRGGYTALTFGNSPDQAGSTSVPESGYWSPETRQTELHSMAWVPQRPDLFVYGSAENEFFAGGNRHSPIVGFYEGTRVLKPRWLFLNPLLSTRSVNVTKGLFWNNRHLLVGALRLCVEGNNCGGEQDSFFVAMSKGEPDNFAYGTDPGFGFQGSQQYQVTVANGVVATRAWASDAAVLEPETFGGLPNGGPRHLIVVGDFRRPSAANPADFDWFITSVRLRGSDGTLTVSGTGIGFGTISSTPAGIDCGASCSANFEADTEVELRATPAAGAFFAGWEADSQCINPGNAVCRVRIDGARQARAIFDVFPLTPGLFKNGFE